ILERVVAAHLAGQAADPPAAEEVLAKQAIGDGAGTIPRDDAAPEQMARIRGDRIDRAFLSVECEHVVAELVAPEVAVEPLAELLRLSFQVGRELLVPPDFASQPSSAHVRVVGIPLDLGGRDRRLRGAAVRELNPGVGVLPAVVLESLRRAALVFEVAVAIEIPFLVDPTERAPRIRLEPSYEGGVCSPALVLVEQDQEE